jgi:hypothetical protein
MMEEILAEGTEIAFPSNSSSHKRKRDNTDLEDEDTLLSANESLGIEAGFPSSTNTAPSTSIAKEPMTKSINRSSFQKRMAYPWSDFLYKIQNINPHHYSAFQQGDETRLSQSVIDELESELQLLSSETCN